MLEREGKKVWTEFIYRGIKSEVDFPECGNEPSDFMQSASLIHEVQLNFTHKLTRQQNITSQQYSEMSVSFHAKFQPANETEWI